MGSRHSAGEKKKTTAIDEVPKERELLFIKDHPDRMRRRSSSTPIVPPIKEERILEDLCDCTDVEPDVPPHNLKQREVQKLIRKISVSEKFTSRFHSQEDFRQHLRKLSDPKAGYVSSATPKRGSLEIPSLESLDSFIQDVSRHSACDLHPRRST